MKLGLITSGFAALFVVTVCGCSSATVERTARTSQSLVATTELHSATISSDASPSAPKVGKSFLAATDDDAVETDHVSAKNALAAPKDDRPADGSRRAGVFGSAK